MCEFCTKHGEGRIWYKNAANYAEDLLSDLSRRNYIETFLNSAFKEGFRSLGRLETIYRKKGRLPEALRAGLIRKAKQEHFGQVLPIEEIRELAGKAKTIVRMPCACRWDMEKREVRCCYAISYGPEPWYNAIDMSYFGLASDEGLESMTAEMALKQMEDLELQGAIHTIWTMMTPFIGAICNCSASGCLAMSTLSKIHVETMERAEYAAVVDETVCNGCGLCDSVCHFHAIDSVMINGRSISRIDRVRCFGCGICRRACSVDAISLILR